MGSWSLGVDLGTSYCAGATAFVTQDGPTGRGPGAGSTVLIEPLEVAGERRVPSTVLLADDRLLAGTHAQRALGRSPDRAERNPKRYVGRPPMLLGGVPVSAEEALTAQLRLFVTEARRRFDDTTPASLVLTHPVAWSAGQRAVLTAAAAAVLPTVTCLLVSEPVAAAWHYAHDHELEPGDSVAVYDLGGGTFDAAVLTAAADGFRVVGVPGGDPDIGGESFDARVYAHFGEQLARSAPEWWESVSGSPERRWLSAAAELLREARLAKESVSDYPSASQYISGADADVEMSRAEFEAMIGDDVDRTDRLLAEVVSGSGVDPAGLRGVFLTGGASRTPLVQSTLKARYAHLVRTWSDPKTVVALGAARWAARTPGRKLTTVVKLGRRDERPGVEPDVGERPDSARPGRERPDPARPGGEQPDPARPGGERAGGERDGDGGAGR